VPTSCALIRATGARTRRGNGPRCKARWPRSDSTAAGAADVRSLFSQLRIRREPTGNVVIEAPPEAASALSALFEGIAALLQEASPPADPANQTVP